MQKISCFHKENTLPFNSHNFTISNQSFSIKYQNRREDAAYIFIFFFYCNSIHIFFLLFFYVDHSIVLVGVYEMCDLPLF